MSNKKSDNNTQNLAVSIIHVALLVSASSTHFLFHAKEDDHGALSFETKEYYPDRSHITYKLIPLATTISESHLPNLSNLLTRVPIPKPAQPGWNCQTWVHGAMLEMEHDDYLPTRWARHYVEDMMQLIYRWTAGAPI